MQADIPAHDADLIETPAFCDYRFLWAHVLSQLVRDARCYWLATTNPDVELEQAFDDLMRCGPMTRHVCRWLDIEPIEVRRKFIRWCESV
jgi:hypothetical protein